MNHTAQSYMYTDVRHLPETGQEAKLSCVASNEHQSVECVCVCVCEVTYMADLSTGGTDDGTLKPFTSR